jgi:hypothetical protein
MKNQLLLFMSLAVRLTNGSYPLGNMTGILKRSMTSFLTSNLKMTRLSQLFEKGRRHSFDQLKLYGLEPNRKLHADTLDPEIDSDGDSVTIQTLEASRGRNLKHQVHDHSDDVNYFLDPTDSFIKVLKRGENEGLATRQPGLHPNQSRFHQPIVYHPSYSFSSWPSQKQTFPSEYYFDFDI